MNIVMKFVCSLLITAVQGSHIDKMYIPQAWLALSILVLAIGS